MRAAEGRMAGERQLHARRKDAQLVVGDAALQKKSGLGKIRPAGDALHRPGVEAFRADHHRDRIAEERLVRKNVDLLEIQRLQRCLRMRSRLWCESVKVGSSRRSSIGSAASLIAGQPSSLRLRVTMIWSVDEYQ